MGTQLTAEARAKFNVTKAWQWFNATEGFEVST